MCDDCAHAHTPPAHQYAEANRGLSQAVWIIWSYTLLHAHAQGHYISIDRALLHPVGLLTAKRRIGGFNSLSINNQTLLNHSLYIKIL